MLEVHTKANLDVEEAASEENPMVEEIFEIPVVEGQPIQVRSQGSAANRQIPVVVGAMPLRYLMGNYGIPYWDPIRQTGYQRRPQEARIRKLVADLEKDRVDLPTAVLLNIRGVDTDDVVTSLKGAKILKIDAAKLRNSSAVFFVVDGQHRILALQKAYENHREAWQDYKIQFVCMLGATERTEMEEFYVVNANAKSVRTDLALDLLKQRAETDGRILDQASERGEDWKIRAQTIARRLNEGSGVWRGRIRLANAPVDSSVLPVASFVNSLKPLLSSAAFRQLSEDNQIKTLDAYWSAVREILRAAFADDDAEKYALMKGVGVIAMHSLFLEVLEHIRASHNSVFDVDAYRAILKPVLEDLQGDNAEGETVVGIDFWKVGGSGAAGSFSSSAGRRVLQAKLRAGLPDLEMQ